MNAKIRLAVSDVRPPGVGGGDGDVDGGGDGDGDQAARVRVTPPVSE